MKYVNVYQSIRCTVFSLFILCFFMNCGENTKSEVPESNQLSVKMHWPGDERVFEKNICDDFGIEIIQVKVVNSGNEIVGQPAFPCTKHGGSVSGIPEGSGYHVIVSAFVDNKEEWLAETKDLLVKKGKTFIDVNMEYIGDDKTPPVVDTVFPKNSQPDVEIDPVITVLMDDELMHSSINSSNFYVKKGLEYVPGTIDHLPRAKNFSFKPIENLEYDTEYTITVGAHIMDNATNIMGDDYTFSFRTVAYNPQTVPDAPKGVKVFPGDSQVYIRWDAVPFAESYWVYYGFSKSISTSNHSDSQEVKDGTFLNWEVLTNKQKHYFMVVAKNKFGESKPSKVKSTTPVLLPVVNDLIAYYDLKNGAAKDQSGNGNDGSVYHTAKAMDQFGKAGHALRFDGIKSYVEFLNPSSFELLEYTIVGVVKVDDITQSSRIISRGYPSYNFSMILNDKQYQLPGSISYLHDTEFKGMTSFDSLIDNSAIPAGKFYHFAVTVGKMVNSGDYFFNSYVNGRLVNSASGISEPGKQSGQLLYFGGAKKNKKLKHAFKGVIDEVIFYKRALKHEEIKKLYDFLNPDRLVSIRNMKTE